MYVALLPQNQIYENYYQILFRLLLVETDFLSSREFVTINDIAEIEAF